MNVKNIYILYIFFFTFCDTFKVKCPVSGAKRLITFENKLPPMLNLTNSVNKCKYEIQMHMLKQPWSF